MKLKLIKLKLSPIVAQLSSAIHYLSYFPAAADNVAFIELIHLNDLLHNVRKIWDRQTDRQINGQTEKLTNRQTYRVRYLVAQHSVRKL